MPKKIVTLAIIVIISLGLYLKNNSTPPTNNNNTQTQHGSEISQSQAQASPPQKDPSPIKKETSKITSAVRIDLIDEKKPMKERIGRIDHINPKNEKEARELIVFINSQNPYLKESLPKPHTYQAIQAQREGSLRVHALKTLAKMSSLEDFRKYTKSIMANATDQTLATIAQKVLEAKEQGRDYFDEVKKGIMSMDIPSDDSHSDSHH